MTTSTETAAAPCATCAAPVRPGARFCTACGAPAAAVTVVEAQPPLRRADARAAARGGAAGARAVAPGAAGSSGGAGPALGAAFDGVRPAGVGVRLAAHAIDAAVVAGVTVAVLALTGEVVHGALALVEVAVGIVVWEARTGRTFGNVALGLRAARRETPYAPGLARAVPRALVLGAGHLVAGVGQWLVVGSSGFDRVLHQGWHDRAGRAVVVDVRGPRAAVTPAPSPAAARPHAAAAQVRVAGAAAPAPTTPSTTAPTSTTSPPITAGGMPRPPVGGTYLVVLDTGESWTVTGPGLVGRAPRPGTGERVDHVIAIDDPERSLSRTHVRFGVDGTGFWVSDAGSGNGTVVALPNGQDVRAGADQRVPVPTGATVRIGDRSFTVRLVAGA